jgi:hypothetical protein
VVGGPCRAGLGQSVDAPASDGAIPCWENAAEPGSVTMTSFLREPDMPVDLLRVGPVGLTQIEVARSVPCPADGPIGSWDDDASCNHLGHSAIVPSEVRGAGLPADMLLRRSASAVAASAAGCRDFSVLVDEWGRQSFPASDPPSNW